MKLVVISPETLEPREHDVLAGLFAAGLERYHVRKPHVSKPALAAWLAELPSASRARLVLHQHHDLVDTLGIGGRHERDVPGRVLAAPLTPAGATPGARRFTSCSCHDLEAVRAALGCCDAVFFGPVFPSISKPGYGPGTDFPADTCAALLASRAERERRTEVLALGGVTAANIPRCRELGFDGVAVLGAIWCAPDPTGAFVELAQQCGAGGDERSARDLDPTAVVAAAAVHIRP